MRHGEIFGDGAAVFDIEDDAALVAAFAPAIDHVAPADGGHVFGPPVQHREPVEMAAVLRRELRDEVRPP
jgi:hypothetical protein